MRSRIEASVPSSREVRIGGDVGGVLRHVAREDDAPDLAAVAPRRVRIEPVAFAVADDQPTFWDRVEAGTWEPATLATLRRLVTSRTTLVDIGAWTGVLALYGAALGAARVIAVEADPAALRQLRRNLAANPALAARVTVVPAAAAATAGPVRLGARRKPGDSMSSTLLPPGEGDWSVDAATPADLAALAAPDGPLLCTLDIEGGEYALLPALVPAIARRGAALLVSFHPAILAAGGPPRALPEEVRAALAGAAARPIGAIGAAPRWDEPDATERCDGWLFSW